MDKRNFIQNPDEQYMEDHIETEGNLPEHPELPIIILLIAFTKDGVDVISFGILGWFATALFTAILWAWIMTKSNIVQRQMNRWIIQRMVLVVAVGFVPGLNFLPEATIMVFLIHHKESAVLKSLYTHLEDTHEIA